MGEFWSKPTSLSEDEAKEGMAMINALEKNVRECDKQIENAEEELHANVQLLTDMLRRGMADGHPVNIIAQGRIRALTDKLKYIEQDQEQATQHRNQAQQEFIMYRDILHQRLQLEVNTKVYEGFKKLNLINSNHVDDLQRKKDAMYQQVSKVHAGRLAHDTKQREKHNDDAARARYDQKMSGKSKLALDFSVDLESNPYVMQIRRALRNEAQSTAERSPTKHPHDDHGSSTTLSLPSTEMPSALSRDEQLAMGD